MTLIYLTPKQVSITTADISAAEQLLLWSIRTWVMGMKRKTDFKTELERAYQAYGIPDASTLLDLFMYCLSFGANRSIDIRCRLNGSISPDELTLLNIMANCQQGKTDLAGCLLADLCGDQYLMQTKAHATAFTDLFRSRTGLTLTCLKLSPPRGSALPGNPKEAKYNKIAQ
ncbi:MAG: hypothetical protein COB54_00255 [Alphaproteobacteria bacterium]|nr:MAG: hypothetical protein COB54_00255 [Alphaproteobacteria bacterium]